MPRHGLRLRLLALAACSAWASAGALRGAGLSSIVGPSVCAPRLRPRAHQLRRRPAAPRACALWSSSCAAQPFSAAEACEQPTAARWRRSGFRRLRDLFRFGRSSPRAALAALASLVIAPALSHAMGAMGAVPTDVNPRGLPMRIAGWAILFVMAAGFAAAETAITTLWPWKIKKIVAEEGEGSSFSTLQDDISRVLTTLLIGVTICTVYSTALATLIISQVFGPKALNIATFALTLLTLIFAEILPKTVAVSQAEPLARLSMPLINTLTTLLKPVSVIVSGITSALTRLIGVQEESEGDGGVSQPELKLMLMGAMRSGSIANYEVEMIEGVLDMENTQVKEVMKPRVDVVAIDANATVRELFDMIDTTKYSRIPVYEETIDNIIGVTRAQSLLTYARDAWVSAEGVRAGVTVSDLMEPTDFVPQTMPVMSALKEMRKKRMHMLIVVDEYGGTAGIVTLEDILEELVGDIYDEADDVQYRTEERQIVTNEDGSFVIDGMADLEEACDALGMHVSEEELREFGTLSGYLCHQAGEIPDAGDEIIAASCKFVIKDCDARKIKRVLAVRVDETDDGPTLDDGGAVDVRSAEGEL